MLLNNGNIININFFPVFLTIFIKMLIATILQKDSHLAQDANRRLKNHLKNANETITWRDIS